MRYSGSLRANHARILVDECVTVAVAHAVVVRSAVLPVIGGILGSPCLRVETAVCALRDVVLAQNVCIEKVARLVRAVGVGVIVIILRRRLARSRTLARIERPIGVDLRTDKAVWSGLRRIDGSAETLRSAEIVTWERRRVFVVACTRRLALISRTDFLYTD